MSLSVYVDGSWVAGGVGYGLVILEGDTIRFEACGPISEADSAGTRQVAGELFAVGHALRWCKAQGIGQVGVYYDYYGIEKWATGEWKAKQPLTQRYREFVRGCGITIRWHKIEAHSGNRWNDYVDGLAKRGAAGERYQGPA
ncbi:MAG: RNase H family protein [Bacteroidia bacterium]|nr:RNase H family protein [Bacteroidia bacterium]